MLLAERDENRCRKPFTPSEGAALGRALELLEKPEAKKRQAQAVGKPRGSKKADSVCSGKLPEQTKGETRDKVAEAVAGPSGRESTSYPGK